MNATPGSALNGIPKARFDAFVGHARAPEVALVATEVAWFESVASEVFAVMIFDTDDEYSGIIFAADLDGRFRAAAGTDCYDTSKEALEALHQKVAHILTDVDAHREQGDETGVPTDFFHARVPTTKQHPSFRLVAEGKGHHAARELIEVLMRWYEDRDGNFIEQFQTTGFDARIWELYLWATFTSLGYKVTMPNPSPDFLARGLDGTFAIEATTINPPQGKGGKPASTPRPQKPEDIQAYGENYLPIRYAGPLTAKLKKKYWEQPAVADLPLIFAIQDFHDEMSMTFSQAGLVAYLYGISVFDTDPTTGRSALITEHSWDTKTIDSGFFNLPEAEHISAVVFNSQGTLAKFTRMAVKGGFDKQGVHIIHTGYRLDVSGDVPKQTHFSGPVEVDYPEDWVDGMDVFHNANALYPLDPGLIPGAAHHICSAEGDITTLYPDGHPVTSKTGIVVPTGGETDLPPDSFQG